ncbi:MAG: DUF3047 domain-containing protein [Candidatus Deferrimicrobiaceae bacterium]
MRTHRVLPVSVSLAVILFLLPGSFLRAEGPEEARKAGWEESTPGRWNSWPERKVEAEGDSFQANVVLAPGTGVLWEKKGNKTLSPGDALVIEMISSGTNGTSRDYERYKAHFPVSVTVVFGKDTMDLPWKKRVGDFFRGIWYGFSPGGIRLTFAFGNSAPVGSMYRLGEEETVFLLGGKGERGKRIRVSRNLKEDFRAAYGRDPKGPVTRILVSAQRPSREDGPIETEIHLSSPLLK